MLMQTKLEVQNVLFINLHISVSIKTRTCLQLRLHVQLRDSHLRLIKTNLCIRLLITSNISLYTLMNGQTLRINMLSTNIIWF